MMFPTDPSAESATVGIARPDAGLFQLAQLLVGHGVLVFHHLAPFRRYPAFKKAVQERPPSSGCATAAASNGTLDQEGD